MEIPWQYNKCILCLEEDALTKEHIIPEVLGGALYVKFLCSKCNSIMGNSIICEIAKDIRVVYAARALRSRIPEVSDKIVEGIDHVLQENGCSYKVRVQGEHYRYIPGKGPDDSLILPEDNAREYLRAAMQRGGLREEDIADKLERYDSAPIDRLIELAGLTVRKMASPRSELLPDSKATVLSESVFPLLLAYEFLSLHLGEKIYEKKMQYLRERILTNSLESPDIKVEELQGDGYDCFHGIAMESNDPHIIIQIRLFGWMAYKVHLYRESFSGPKAIYTYCLDTKEHHWGLLK